MPSNMPALGITEVVLRDAHQSLFATRMRIDDMLPIAEKLDQIGYWSMESWGGATFDSCIRYLGEDPWDRIREIKKAMPNTPQQMLFRGQNILGYRHYADDVVEKFVERAAANGIDVFRVFDAMNDMRNLETALRAVKQVGKHAQGTISYTVSPVHTIDLWVDQARQIEDAGADSICIKDMAGLLTPYVGYELVTKLKKAVSIPLQLHAHATTGLSTTTITKCVEAGIDNVDTAISSMSMTYGHSATESVVSIFEGSERDTGLKIDKLEEIAAYFREVRKKYSAFEGSLRGVDSRILVAQVPGGMLTNMESQLREQGAGDRLDEVLAEIPRVREDLGFIPLVTPTSQIVGTQAVLNVLTGERYKSISKETAGVLRGEYGAAPAPVNAELQARVLDEGEQAITCRPADNLDPELEALTAELEGLSAEHGFQLCAGEGQIDDVLTYALFPQVGLKFLQNKDNPAAFEPVPTAGAAVQTNEAGEEIYTVEVEGKSYTVAVANGGDISAIAGAAAVAPAAGSAAPVAATGGSPVNAPLAGTVVKVLVKPGQAVAEGETIIILEAMKMETSVSAPAAGSIVEVRVQGGDSCAVGDVLVTLA
ncbi:sodium-extruding oxaloacetate decarboxylase subunit alpha [SAR92 clade bacterium H231]|jgi:oxaloacetate decarboxylase alpha subunit|nr:sodium-extruding oxaloacetate decarboxylase subunit alpha [Porticoccaceae bacterium]MCT2533733.1 sodium-extruding oxaloacetate decarboxylase subunit alpha [SAR92 clade bacterium H231]MBT7258962.1 sodium-extruding oxaloacetate decarboxylase subunit alpha [Porticoccaceae bacterium]MBT7904879.1 sodium-extruding oxaloacetate decarboxylase subunit alpha [Porticoccaceae bacterium]MDA7815538.1 sodium-extruding oxaloacetate decarboxylase subunit alpha [Porticoccaceae bacterium]